MPATVENVFRGNSCGGRILTALVAVASFLATASNLFSEPEVTGGAMRMGTSVRLKPFTPAAFHCLIKNPDSKAHNVSLMISPADDTFSVAPEITFMDTVYVPASTTYDYNSTVMSSTTENYLLTSFSDGSKLPNRGESIPVKMLYSKSPHYGILNDSADINFGSMVNFPDMKDKFFPVFFSSRSMPISPEGLDGIDVLIFLDLNFDNMNTAQFNALHEYVRTGGLLVFAYPESTLKAALTPIGDLIPVKPVRVRKVDEVKALSAIVKDFKGVKLCDFLESTPAENSIVLIKDYGMPLVAYKKFGLGTAMLISIPLSDDVYNDKSDWKELARFVMSRQDLYNEERGFSNCIDEMTGFTVPGTATVFKIIIVYFLLLATAFVAGHFLKRNISAWGVCILIATIMTLNILSKAKNAAKNNGTIFSGVELTIPGDFSDNTTLYCGLFSDRNRQVTLKAPNTGSFISTILPRDYSGIPRFNSEQASGGSRGGFFSGSGMESTQQESSQNVQRVQLIVQRIDGIPELSDVPLQSLRLKQFKAKACLQTNLREPILPELVYLKSGYELKGWKSPDGLEPEFAFLAFQNGVLPVNVSGGQISFRNNESDKMFSTDVLSKQIMNAVHNGDRLPSPALLVATRMENPLMSLPEGFRCQGKKIMVYPVREKYSEDEILIGPEQISLTAGNTSSKIIIDGNRLNSNQEGLYSSSEYSIDFQVPPHFRLIKPSEIRIYFSFSNPGGNLILEPRLVKLEALPDSKNPQPKPLYAEFRPDQVVNGKTKNDGVFSFAGKEIGGIIDPITGKGRFLITVNEKNPLMDPVQRRRANALSITNLSVSVKGFINENLTGSTY